MSEFGIFVMGDEANDEVIEKMDDWINVIVRFENGPFPFIGKAGGCITRRDLLLSDPVQLRKSPGGDILVSISRLVVVSTEELCNVPVESQP